MEVIESIVPRLDCKNSHRRSSWASGWTWHISLSIESFVRFLCTKFSRKRVLFASESANSCKGDTFNVEYIRIFKNICDDLAAIGKPVDDKAKVVGLLKGLVLEYESFITNILKPPIFSYSDLIPLLQGHDTMKSLYTQSTFNSPN
ncbi:hypothetical protein ACH5RR_022450 [Cinchona calisaya]|uniref:Uncharacterized protein n=1 Tax=Cinchona calisaya TaxID=153742 RepID=A0ABD2Z7V2_9GENT